MIFSLIFLSFQVLITFRYTSSFTNNLFVMFTIQHFSLLSVERKPHEYPDFFFLITDRLSFSCAKYLKLHFAHIINLTNFIGL